MARARNLKPSLFDNELLGDEKTDLACTVLFEGLWTLADREGRLEDRPRKIHVKIFPYRPSLKIDALLQWLHVNEFIVRYEVSGGRYIQIVNFLKHQSPHRNEVESVIPAFTAVIEESRKIASAQEKDRSAHASSLTALTLNSESVATAVADETVDEKVKPEKKYTLPEDFSISASMREWASEEAPNILVDDELAEFKTFWIDIATKNHRRTARGWIATWQNRMRDLQKTRFGAVKKPANGNGHKPAWKIAIENCSKCDEKGYIKINGRAGVCTHK